MYNLHTNIRAVPHCAGAGFIFVFRDPAFCTAFAARPPRYPGGSSPASTILPIRSFDHFPILCGASDFGPPW
jgi:hypothetical protein